ncbi:MAG: glycosyltransferase family 2 protein [Bacteroidetes bacterium]|nr:MAG: glycosyltransferase family 2 protein [Bacteroidota bacterium]
MPGHPFSTVIITKNEAENIRPCLAAIRHVCTDIIVVDAQSTDKTPDICREMGARVFEKAWEGYSENKNFGNARARHDWILSVDADEVLSPALIETLENWTPRPKTVYALDRISSFCGQWIRHGAWYPDWKIRLFDRRVVQWTGDFVHEKPDYPPDFKVVRLKGKLYHYTCKDPSEFYARLDQYARLAALEMFEKGQKPSFFKQFFSPGFRFFRDYFLRKGFLDGRAGRDIARANACVVSRKYARLKELYQTKHRGN